jgi:hypothetical protein
VPPKPSSVVLAGDFLDFLDGDSTYLRSIKFSVSGSIFYLSFKDLNSFLIGDDDS